eukprot:TRINITY_DN18617_c1_g1_i1.p1 TRINITY_DN18617_c1_g1~~TRINITY_DN18617_c1_g1_i1.p1  ORF type:complete len:701 (+),score=134.89 TRINITY_DN18617_c1_g1_i1:524-2626(+)
MRFALLLSLAAFVSAEGVCQENFNKFYKVRNETKPGEGMSRDEYMKIKEKAMDSALDHLRDCLDVEDESQYHTEALELMASTYVDKKRFNLAVGAMERIAETDKDTMHYMKLAKIMQQGGMFSESIEVLGNEMSKTSSKENDNWEDFRYRVANMPYSGNISEYLSFTNHSSMLVQLLLSSSRGAGDVQGVAETMAFALNLVPYNSQIRRVVLHYSGPLLDLPTIWRIFAMPPGYNYTATAFRDSINGFALLLPSIVSSTVRNLYSTGDGDQWSTSLRSYIKLKCDFDIPKSDYITRSQMVQAATGCFTKSPILQEWKEIAASLDVTLESVLAEESNTTNTTSLEVLREFGEGFLEAIYPQAPAAEKPACPEPDFASSLTALQESFEAAAASYDVKSEWGRVPVDDKTWIKWEQSEQFDPALQPAFEAPAKADVAYEKISSDSELEERFFKCGRPVVLRDSLVADDGIRETQQLIFNFTVLMKTLGTTLMEYDESHQLKPSPLSTTIPGKASLLAFAFEQMANFNRTIIKSPMRGPFKKVIAVPEAMEEHLSEKVRNVSNFHFTAGASGSGESMVFGDGSFANYMWNGQRVWLLLPPSHALFSSLTPLETYKKLTADESLADSLITTFQFSGDAIFVPAGWSYLYINLRASVGYSAVFPWGNSFPLHEEAKPADRPEPPKKPASRDGGSVTIGVTPEKDEL